MLDLGRNRRIVLLLVILAIHAPSAARADTRGELIGRIWQEARDTHLHELLFASLGWILSGALLGGLLAAVFIFVSDKFGWWNSSWKHARWVRWTLWLSMLSASVLCLGLAGFWQGLSRGGEQVLRRSQIATQVLPPVGNALADGLAALQVMPSMTNDMAAVRAQVAMQVEEFRAGKWEFQAVSFVEQLDQLHAGTVSNVVAKIESEAVSRVPVFADGLYRRLLHSALEILGKTLVNEKIERELNRVGMADLLKKLQKQLPAEARRVGNPETIARSELSGFLVQEVMIPALMHPIRSLARTNILLCASLNALLAAVSLIGFRLTCGRVKTSSAGASPPPATSA